MVSLLHYCPMSLCLLYLIKMYYFTADTELANKLNSFNNFCHCICGMIIVFSLCNKDLEKHIIYIHKLQNGVIGKLTHKITMHVHIIQLILVDYSPYLTTI